MDNNKMNVTVTLPTQLASYIEQQRRETDDLTYKSAVAHALHQAGSMPALSPSSQTKRLTVEVDADQLPAIEGNQSDRIRFALWAGLLSSTRERLESILGQFIPDDELPAVLEQINHIIVPLTGHEFFSEEKSNGKT
jgi:hypothetical protein